MAKLKGKKRRRKVRKKRAWTRGAKQRVKRLYRIRKRRRKKSPGYGGFLRGAISKLWAAITSPGYTKEAKKMMARIRRYRVRARGKTKSGRKKYGARDKENLTEKQRSLLREAKDFFRKGVGPRGGAGGGPFVNYGGTKGGALVVAAKRRRRRKRRRNPTTRRVKRRRTKRRARKGRRRTRRRL